MLEAIEAITLTVGEIPIGTKVRFMDGGKVNRVEQEREQGFRMVLVGSPIDITVGTQATVTSIGLLRTPGMSGRGFPHNDNTEVRHGQTFNLPGLLINDQTVVLLSSRTTFEVID